MNPLHRLAQTMRLMIGRAILSAVNDGGAFQLIQAERLSDETADDLERFGSYGLTSVPHAGAELVIVSAGGVRSHGLVIACEDRRYRLKGLQAGEVALYDDLGQVVKLGRDGITIQSAQHLQIEASSIEMRSDTIDLIGDVLIVGDLEVTVNAEIGGNLKVDGNSDLGGAGSKFVKRIDDSPSTKVKA